MPETSKLAKLEKRVLELQTESGFLRSTLDAVSANIAILDESGRIIFINQEWRHFAKANGLLWGDYGLGRNYLDVCRAVSGEDAALVRMADQGLRSVLNRSCGDFAMDYPCHSPDQQRWFQMRASRFEEMGSLRVVVTHVDITERKLAEEASQASEDRFHSLFRDLPIAIWEEDWTDIRDFLDALPDIGNQPLILYLKNNPQVVRQCLELARVIGVNRSTLELFEADREEELFKDLARLFVAETYAAYRKALVALQAGKTRLEMETRVKTLGGTEKEINLRWSLPSGRQARPVRVLISMIDITKRKRAERKIFQYQKRLRSLSSELTLLEEKERRRIAADLHDNIGQTLAMAKIKLGALGEAVSSAGSEKLLNEIKKLIEESITYTRSLTSEVSPPVLYHLSFESSVEWLVENILEKSGLAVTIEDDGNPKPLEDDTRVLLFKVVRELMINIVKHAKARNVSISMRREDNWMLTQVVDDGIGFEWPEGEGPTESRQKYGLFTIRERISYLGGRLEISSRGPSGTRVSVRVPLSGDKGRRSAEF